LRKRLFIIIITLVHKKGLRFLKRTEQKEITKKRIFELALSLFMDKGYENVSIDTIVKNLGLTKGAFYHHFVSKEAILVEYINLTIEQLTERLFNTIHESKDINGIKILEGLFDEIGYYVVENDAQIKVIFSQAKYANVFVDDLFINEFSQVFQNVLLFGENRGEFNLINDSGTLAKYISMLIYFKIKDSFTDEQKNISKEIRDIFDLFMNGIFAPK
jgi:AcrR family transcriptional regulator